MYVTFYKKSQQEVQPTVQISFEDLFTSNGDMPTPNMPGLTSFARDTMTVITDTPPRSFNQVLINTIIDNLFELIRPVVRPDIDTLYKTFHIPKRSRGLREINAPIEPLMSILRTMKGVFETQLKCLNHNAAYAYTKNRCCKNALEVHQKAESKWFLKLDIKDFFPNCNPEFIFQQLKKLYPFAYANDDKLKSIIAVCIKDNGLPQGTPMSPTLTNLIMIPIDVELEKYCQSKGFTYTRYADDLLISSKYDFTYSEVINKLDKIFEEQNAPFIIKREKTRYGSSAGRNWNLGLMLNKDNKITIGNKRKRTFKVVLNNFLEAYYRNEPWSVEDTQHLVGLISYYRNIEPEQVNDLINRYESKYTTSTEYKSFKDIVKSILNPNDTTVTVDITPVRGERGIPGTQEVQAVPLEYDSPF